MLPEGWRKNTFSDGISLISGQHVEAKLVNSQGQGTPYLTGPADFPERKIITKKYTEFGNSFCKKDDILITVKGSGTGKIIRSDGHYAISRQLMAIQAEKYDPDFTYFSLCHNIIRYQGAAAGLIPGIGRNDILSTPILLPPLPEQKKIAAILSTWDCAIEGTEKLLANSQQQKKALMQQLLTGKKRLPGFTGEWENTKLGNYISERKQRNKNSISQLVLSITNRLGFEKPEEYFSKRVASSDISNYKVVKLGDFGYNPSRINVGSFARLKKHTIAVVSPIYVVFHTSEKNLDGTYFDFWMNSHPAQQQVLNSTQGSVRNSVSFDSLCQFKIKLPPLPEQKAIAAVLTTADEEITTLKSDLARLRQEKKALMQQLLTGKRRVTVD